MKRVFNARNTALALFTAFAAVLATTAQASEDPKSASVELKFIGHFRSKPVFELKFNTNGIRKDYTLQIRDEFGNSLYREKINNQVFSKKFMLNTDEVDEGILRFEISNLQDEKILVYEINRNSRFVEEVLIHKIN